jgi:hypothetical protein
MSAPETKPPDGHPDERVWLRGFEAGVIQMRHDFAGLIAERDALAERVERLEVALRPFAAYGALRGMDLVPDDMALTKGSNLAARQVTAGDFRRARAALSTAQEG